MPRSSDPLGSETKGGNSVTQPEREEPFWHVTLAPAVTRYPFVSRALGLLVPIIGIPVLPIWLLGFGQWYARDWARRFSCTLTAERLHVQLGVFVRSLFDIPLDRITDIRLYHGPLMRLFDVVGLKIETAGQGATQSEGNLIGVMDSIGFRDAVLRQRDAIASGTGADKFHEQVLGLLNEILATLKGGGSSSPS